MPPPPSVICRPPQSAGGDRPHCIPWSQMHSPSFTTSDVRYHTALWDSRSTAQR